jgi:hypothetical protein
MYVPSRVALSPRPRMVVSRLGRIATRAFSRVDGVTLYFFSHRHAPEWRHSVHAGSEVVVYN